MAACAVRDLAEALALLARSRDNDAWAFLLEQVGADIERLAARLTWDTALSQDVVQDTLLQIRDHAGRFKPIGEDANASARRWIMRVTANTSLTMLRTRRNTRRRHAAAHVHSPRQQPKPPDRSMEEAEQAHLVRIALADLPERNRTAIVLHHIAGLGFPEVAIELGCPLGTAKTHVRRGLERLRNNLLRLGVSLPAVAIICTLQQAPAAVTAIGAAHAALLVAPIKASSIPAITSLTGASLAMKSLIAAAIIITATTTTYVSAAQSAPKRSGPLAAMPSAPGPHIAKIKALGDNQWLNLGPAAPDPKWGSGSVRSWGCSMEYASDLGGAFISGQGPHAYVKPDGHYDDIFFYDLNAHRWVCLVPGIDTKTFAADIKKGEITIGDKNYLIYKDGQPVYATGGHCYHGHYYDSDRHLFVTGGWPSGIPLDMHCQNGQSPWFIEGRKALEEQLKGRSVPQDWLGYTYDATTGKLSREMPKGQFYVASRKGCWTYWGNMTSLSSVGQLNPKGPLPEVNYGGDFGACVDTKRERIYLGRMNKPKSNPQEGDWYIYDFRDNSWSIPPTKGSAELIPATNSGVVNYDSANDRVVEFYSWNHNGTRGIAVWDPAANAWDPKIALPDNVPTSGCVSGFYSPELNAHFLHLGGDGVAGGDIWVYRYKNAGKTRK
jgi:RNA polymerase sigma-70 factor, ECF subfamily